MASGNAMFIVSCGVERALRRASPSLAGLRFFECFGTPQLPMLVFLPVIARTRDSRPRSRTCTLHQYTLRWHNMAKHGNEKVVCQSNPRFRAPLAGVGGA